MQPVAVGELIPTPAGKLPLRRVGDWYVLEIRGGRDVPDYDPDEVARGLSDSARRREVEGDWTATAGKLVYPKFTAEHVAREPLPYDPERPLVIGWDLPGANGGTPAMVPMQVAHTGQVFVWEALVPPEDRSIGLYEFADWVAGYLYREFAEPNRLHIRKSPQIRTVHYADPAGRQKPPATGGGPRGEMRSAFEVLEKGLEIVTGYDERGEAEIEVKPGWGWRIEAGEVSLRKRLEQVRALLERQPYSGLPGLVVDPRAQTLQDAFQGGYHYRERSDGSYEPDPAKNWYSHPMNALEYSCSRLAAARMPDPDDEYTPSRALRHRGAGRRITQDDAY